MVEVLPAGVGEVGQGAVQEGQIVRVGDFVRAHAERIARTPRLRVGGGNVRHRHVRRSGGRQVVGGRRWSDGERTASTEADDPGGLGLSIDAEPRLVHARCPFHGDRCAVFQENREVGRKEGTARRTHTGVQAVARIARDRHRDAGASLRHAEPCPGPGGGRAVCGDRGVRQRGRLRVGPVPSAGAAVRRAAGPVLHPLADVAGCVVEPVAVGRVGGLEAAVLPPVVVTGRRRPVVVGIAAVLVIRVGPGERVAAKPVRGVGGTRPGGSLVPLVVRGGGGSLLVHGQAISADRGDQGLPLGRIQIARGPVRGGDHDRPPVRRGRAFRVGPLVRIAALHNGEPVAELHRPVPAHARNRELLFARLDDICVCIEENGCRVTGIEEHRSGARRADLADRSGGVDVHAAAVRIVIQVAAQGRGPVGLAEGAVQKCRKLGVRDFSLADAERVRRSAGLGVVGRDDGHVQGHGRIPHGERRYANGRVAGDVVAEQDARRVRPGRQGADDRRIQCDCDVLLEVRTDEQSITPGQLRLTVDQQPRLEWVQIGRDFADQEARLVVDHRVDRGGWRERPALRPLGLVRVLRLHRQRAGDVETDGPGFEERPGGGLIERERCRCGRALQEFVGLVVQRYFHHRDGERLENDGRLRLTIDPKPRSIGRDFDRQGFPAAVRQRVREGLRRERPGIRAGKRATLPGVRRQDGRQVRLRTGDAEPHVIPRVRGIVGRGGVRPHEAARQVERAPARPPRRRTAGLVLHPLKDVSAGVVQAVPVVRIERERLVGQPVDSVVEARGRGPVVEGVAAVLVVGVGPGQDVAAEAVRGVGGAGPRGGLVPLVVQRGSGSGVIHGQTEPVDGGGKLQPFRRVEVSRLPVGGRDRDRMPVGRRPAFRVRPMPGGQPLVQGEPVAVLQRAVPAHADNRMVLILGRNRVDAAGIADATAVGRLEHQGPGPRRSGYPVLGGVQVHVARVDVEIEVVPVFVGQVAQGVVQKGDKLRVGHFVHANAEIVCGARGLSVRSGYGRQIRLDCDDRGKRTAPQPADARDHHSRTPTHQLPPRRSRRTAHPGTSAQTVCSISASLVGLGPCLSDNPWKGFQRMHGFGQRRTGRKDGLPRRAGSDAGRGPGLRPVAFSGQNLRSVEPASPV